MECGNSYISFKLNRKIFCTQHLIMFSQFLYFHRGIAIKVPHHQQRIKTKPSEELCHSLFLSLVTLFSLQGCTVPLAPTPCLGWPRFLKNGGLRATSQQRCTTCPWACPLLHWVPSSMVARTGHARPHLSQPTCSSQHSWAGNTWRYHREFCLSPALAAWVVRPTRAVFCT